MEIKMTRYLLLLAMLFVLASCKTMRPISNLEIGPTASRYLEISSLHSGIASSNLLRVGLSGFNTSLQNREVRYRFAWLDNSHFEIPGLSSRWQYTTLQAKESFSFEMIAPTPSASHYKVYLFDVK